MADDDLEQGLIRHLRQAGLITPEQFARAEADAARSGAPLSDVLVRLGLLTGGQRETLLRKLRDRQDGPRRVGPYAILRKLGQGGMGTVYLAQRPDGAAVALKVLSREQAAQGDARPRFKREAEAALKLRHPHLVRALEAGEDEGLAYYSMEYVEGGTLDALLAKSPRLPIERAIDLVLQTARGLDYAHRQGFIHRDVKPANILLGADGVAKLLDLGLTKDLGGESSLRTVTGAVMGTPQYVSPEQARGDKTIDARADLYSLGVTFYHLLTGRLPFEGTTALAILSKHLHQKLPDPREYRPELHEDVLQVLLRMMAKEPRHRYDDAASLIVDLEELAAGRPPKSARIEAELTTLAQPRVGSNPNPTPTPARRRKLLLPGLIAAAVVAGITAWALAGAPSAPPPAAPPPTPAPAPWIDLIASIDPAQDIRVGGWQREGDALVADGTANAGCQVPYSPPREYDLVVEFTRDHRGCETGVYGVHGGTVFLLGLAGWGGGISGISTVGGKPYGENATKRSADLQPKHRYRLEVEVRKDSVRALLDGVEHVRWDPSLGALGPPGGAAPMGPLLGLSNCETRTVFHRFAIRERDGRGKPGR